MPSGKSHDRLTLLTAVATVPFWVLAAPKHDPAVYISGIGAYLFSGFWLSGDLDTNSLSYKRWGVFKFIWWPYRLLVPHRSCLSHGLVVGPLLRVAYFAFSSYVVARCAIAVVNKYFLVVDRTGILVHVKVSLTGWLLQHPKAAIAAAIGLILGGFTHTIADVLVSFWKRVW